jgi:hypothetical protein
MVVAILRYTTLQYFTIHYNTIRCPISKLYLRNFYCDTLQYFTILYNTQTLPTQTLQTAQSFSMHYFRSDGAKTTYVKRGTILARQFCGTEVERRCTASKFKTV